MKDLLTDLLEYMESRADADIEGPNKEMGFQIRIEEALAELSTEGLKLSDDLVVKSLAAIHKSEQDLPAPNTVIWWLCRIADPEIRRRAVRDFDLFPMHEDYKTTSDTLSVKGAIDSIDWDNAVSFEFYQKLYLSEIPLLPTPEWKEYLELKSKP